MIYEKKSAVEAVLHFEKNGFRDAFAGKTGGNKEYDRAYKIIKSARLGYVSDTRARFLLETYGGGRYKCSSVFEVEAGSNGAAFDEQARTLGEDLKELNTTI
jgi:hypothetical protein